VPLYALSNWSAETFARSRARFPFLEWFRGIVVSGQERLIKPDPRIFAVLLERCRQSSRLTSFLASSIAGTPGFRSAVSAR
jgi:2-haloacid dehalogenase